MTPRRAVVAVAVLIAAAASVLAAAAWACAGLPDSEDDMS